MALGRVTSARAGRTCDEGPCPGRADDTNDGTGDAWGREKRDHPHHPPEKKFDAEAVCAGTAALAGGVCVLASASSRPPASATCRSATPPAPGRGSTASCWWPCSRRPCATPAPFPLAASAGHRCRSRWRDFISRCTRSSALSSRRFTGARMFARWPEVSRSLADPPRKRVAQIANCFREPARPQRGWTFPKAPIDSKLN